MGEQTDKIGKFRELDEQTDIIGRFRELVINVNLEKYGNWRKF